MENTIIIFNRSDSEANVPKIMIRSRSDTKKSNIIEEVRKNLLQRKTDFVIEITTEEAREYGSDNKQLPIYLINRACSFKMPFVSDDFDYLRRNVRKIYCEMKITSKTIVLSYKNVYLTTLAQEEQINMKLHEIFVENNLYKLKEPIDKIRFIYNYIAKRVKYDHTYTRYSAYNALFSHSAVCEGCASLMYRMLSMAGIPCRIITGKGKRESHAWNIIKINGHWYNADVTWDLCETSMGGFFSVYRYFLKADANFPDHIRDADFLTPQFVETHSMSKRDF